MRDFKKHWATICSRNNGFAEAKPDDQLRMTMKQLRSNLEKLYDKGYDDAIADAACNTDVTKLFGNIFGGSV